MTWRTEGFDVSPLENVVITNLVMNTARDELVAQVERRALIKRRSHWKK